ncbi:hypothetical protein EDD90_0673 [Streptomyces sp. Ag109_O5-1]|nr:hypothetical protein EDD90_0673 [Streptomyces sp. Ag109_O5-1]
MRIGWQFGVDPADGVVTAVDCAGVAVTKETCEAQAGRAARRLSALTVRNRPKGGRWRLRRHRRLVTRQRQDGPAGTGPRTRPGRPASTQTAAQPLSTGRIAPLMLPAASEARKTIAAACSSGSETWPTLPK